MDVVSGVRVAGVASAAPLAQSPLAALAGQGAFSSSEIEKVGKSLGVRTRRVSSDQICASDLCFAAAERLLDDLAWDRSEVDALLFVTQTPDYFLPATSCVLQARLGLSDRCAAFDINLGCSGYVYALYVAGKMLGGNLRKILILVGDTISKIVSDLDRSTAAVFGDAGSATALVADASAPGMFFEVGTDGTGKDILMVPAGAFRRRATAETAELAPGEDGSRRSPQHLYMDGPSVFSFALNRVPDAVARVREATGWDLDAIDAFVFHQANRFMLDYLAKKMKLPPARVPIALEEFGNTSSASIPLTLTAMLAESLAAAPRRLILAGFGVGLSWAVAGVTIGPAIMPPLVEVE